LRVDQGRVLTLFDGQFLPMFVGPDITSVAQQAGPKLFYRGAIRYNSIPVRAPSGPFAVRQSPAKCASAKGITNAMEVVVGGLSSGRFRQLASFPAHQWMPRQP
jgi:hypothetical protein